MRPLYVMLGAALALLAAAPPPAATASAWDDRPDALPIVRRAGISVPRTAGPLTLKELGDLGKEGLDNIAQYSSGDEALSGTIFIYFPTLADTGLTFLATDATIRHRFGAETKVADDRLVTVGAVPNAGRRVIYTGASEGRRSTTAMFVRAGGWIVVLRVSGPASRVAEIAGALDALGTGLRFGNRNNPVPAHVIATSRCEPRDDNPAPLAKPRGPEMTALLVLAATGELRDQAGKTLPDLLGRVPDRLCLARESMLGEATVLTYRAVDKPKGLFAPKLFHLIGDAGYIVEATATSNQPDHTIMVRHTIGQLFAYGVFEGIPALAQVDRVIEGDPAFPIVGTAILKPEGGTNVHLDCEDLQESCAKNGGAVTPPGSQAVSGPLAISSSR
jgi:hypothetical protein